MFTARDCLLLAKVGEFLYSMNINMYYNYYIITFSKFQKLSKRKERYQINCKKIQVDTLSSIELDMMTRILIIFNSVGCQSMCNSQGLSPSSKSSG